MANKKTVVEMYEEILAIEGLTDEQKAFIEKRIEITKKKNANRGENAEPTAKQKENEGIKATILTELAKVAKPTTITDFIKGSEPLSGYSNQKISSLMGQLLTDNKVVRVVEKGKSYYSLPTED